MTMPVPPTGALSGPNGTMMRRGSAGHLGLNTEVDEGEFDPCTTSRCNVSEIDEFSEAPDGPFE